MSDNKKIDFGLLENADISAVEEMGINDMEIGKDARNKMLRNTFRKYENEKKLTGDGIDKTSDPDEAEDCVTGVDKIEKRGISRIVYSALCSAAVLVIAAGSIYMLKHNSKPAPYVQDPIAAATTTVTETTAVPETTTVPLQTSSDTTVTTADITTLYTSPHDDSAAVENGLSPCKNPCPQQKSVTDEEIDDARKRAIDDMMENGTRYKDNDEEKRAKNDLQNIEYALADVNGDSVPELFVRAELLAGSTEFMFVYDGYDYVPVQYNVHGWDGDVLNNYLFANSITICPEENLICAASIGGYRYAQILYFSEDNTITTLMEENYTGIYKNGALIYEFGDDRLSDVRSDFGDEYRTHDFKTPEYIFYAISNQTTDETGN